MRAAAPIPCHCTVCDLDFERMRKRGNMAVCSPCQRKKRVADWHLANPGRKYELRKQWFENNPEKTRASKTAWQKRNPEKEAVKAAAWRAANPDKVREITKRHYWCNRDKIIRDVVERNAKHRTPPWADLDAIAAIYAKSRAVSRATGIQHHVDHFIPIKGQMVCGLHVETNLRVIPAAENIRKFNKFHEANL